MAFVRYTTLRLLLFVVVAALLWIVGIRDYWLLLFAVLVSGVISLFALSRSRDEMSSSLVTRRERIKQRMAEQTAAEDQWNDQVRRAEDQGRTNGGAGNNT
jgi:hypothetical protein